MISRSYLINNGKLKDRSELHLVIVSSLLFLVFLAYLRVGLGFQLLHSDALSYWNESFNWKRPFSNWWVPGYSLTIALVRGVTFNLLSPTAVMIAISGAFYLIGVRAAYLLARELKIDFAFYVALLFALYPFVGLTYSVYPIADSMATALLLLASLAFLKQEWIAFAIYSGLAMLTHKATWFFIPPLLLVVFARHKEARWPLLFVPLPLLIWMVAGGLYHNDAFWFARWSVANLVVSKTTLPVFAGVVDPLLSANSPKIAKGLIVLATFFSTIVVFIYSVRFRFWLGISITLSIISMIALLNEYEIWATVRWSKMLLLPFSYVLVKQFPALKRAKVSSPAFLVVSVLAFITNVLFGYYFTKFLSG